MEFITLKNKNNFKIIEEVLLYPLKINQDESGGILVETLRKDWPEIYGPDREFSMQYYSVTDSGVARDERVWHLHQEQEDRFLVVKGAIITAVADDRKTSMTNGLLNLFYMQADKDPYLLLIPKGTLHGFMVVSIDAGILLNFPTKLYSLKDEKRIPHNKVNIKLPDGSIFTWEKVRQETVTNE